MPGRERVLVDKRKDFAVRHLLHFAEPKTQQDPLFNPRVDDPASIDLCSGADFATSKARAEVKKDSARLVRTGNRRARGQTLNGRLQFADGCSVRRAVSSRRDETSRAKSPIDLKGESYKLTAKC